MPHRNYPFAIQEGKSTSVPYTKEQLQEFFKKYDIDGDKFLTLADLKKAFRDLGSILPNFRAHSAMARADADGDKRISQQEIEAVVDYAMRSLVPFKTDSVPYTKQQSPEFFKQHNKDEDKFLSKAEPKKAFDDLHSRNAGNAGFGAMSEAVEDGDDHISQQEMGALPQSRPLKNKSRRNPKQEHKTTSVRDTDQKSQVKERDRDKFLSEEADIKHSRDHGVGVRRAMTKVVEDGDDHFSQREMGALPQSPPLKNISRWNPNQEHKSVRDTDKKLQEGIIAALTCRCFQSKENNGQS